MKIVIDIPEGLFEAYKGRSPRLGDEGMDMIAQAIANGTPISKGHARRFEEIVVRYLPDEICIYPEYRGKPYFSIKYEENEEHFIGFGTYKPEVLSSYLREYFIAPTIIEADKEAENEEV